MSSRVLADEGMIQNTAHQKRLQRCQQGRRLRPQHLPSDRDACSGSLGAGFSERGPAMCTRGRCEAPLQRHCCCAVLQSLGSDRSSARSTAAKCLLLAWRSHVTRSKGCRAMRTENIMGAGQTCPDAACPARSRPPRPAAAAAPHPAPLTPAATGARPVYSVLTLAGGW